MSLAVARGDATERKCPPDPTGARAQTGLRHAMMVTALASMIGGCAISTERDVGDLVDAPVDDVGSSLEVDGGIDADAPRPGLRHLLLLYWPYGLVDWMPERMSGGYRVGPAMARLRREDLALITDLSAPAPVAEFHTEITLSIWTGNTDTLGGFGEAYVTQPSLDVVVARQFGGAPMVTRTTAAGHRVFETFVSWSSRGVPTPLIRDATAAAAAVPCTSRSFPELTTAESVSFETMTDVAREQIRFAVDGFRNGCLSAAGIELGDPSVAMRGDSVYQLWHDRIETPTATLAEVTEALSIWLSDVLAELAATGVLDDTLVVLTIQHGGDDPLLHRHTMMPVFLWSRAPRFRAGWIEGGGRPIRDWLVTVARELGSDATFAELDPPAVPIDGLFTD